MEEDTHISCKLEQMAFPQIKVDYNDYLKISERTFSLMFFMQKAVDSADNSNRGLKSEQMTPRYTVNKSK